MIRSDGSVSDVGAGQPMLGGGSRWICPICDRPIRNSCRFLLEDITNPTLSIPIATTYEHLTVLRNGLPTVHHPIPSVTRDGGCALIVAFANGRTDLLQVDLISGIASSIYSFDSGVVERGFDGRPVALWAVDPFAMFSRDGRHVVLGRHHYVVDAATGFTTVRATAEVLTVVTGAIEPLSLGLADGYVIGTSG